MTEVQEQDRTALYQQLAEIFHQPLERIIEIAAPFASMEILESIEHNKRAGEPSLFVDVFEQELFGHCAQVKVMEQRPGWLVLSPMLLPSMRWETRRFLLVHSLKLPTDTAPELHGTDLVAILPDGQINTIKLDGWPQQIKGNEGESVLVPFEPRDGEWWRNYPWSQEQQKYWQAMWGWHQTELLKGIKDIVGEGGGGLGGRSTTWSDPDGTSSSLKLFFFLPPQEPGYLSPAGKQSLLANAEAFYKGIKQAIEES